MDTRALVTVLFALPCLLPACGNKKKNDPNEPSAWLVGEQAEMYRLGDGHEVDVYDVDADGDFRAIACVGTASAWVVGQAGLVMVTRDVGDSWQRVDVNVGADLVAVAAADDDEAQGTVYVAGQGGVVLRSLDGGTQWEPLAAPNLDWTDIATDHRGGLAIASAADGSLWRAASGEFTSMLPGGGDALRGVSLSSDGQHAAAVGDRGQLWVSHDGARSWAAVALPTERDLQAVRIAADGQTVVAVGEAGVVVRVDEGGAQVQELLDGGLSLRGLHLRAPGRGHAVGDDGTVMRTEDAGITWEPIEIAGAGTLHGVDDFHDGVHL